jgi:hypothetical protein
MTSVPPVICRMADGWCLICYLCLFAHCGVQHVLTTSRTWRVSYKRQELLMVTSICLHTQFLLGLLLLIFLSFLCCVLLFCLVSSSCVPYVFCLVSSSCVPYVLCLVNSSCVPYVFCLVSSSCVPYVFCLVSSSCVPYVFCLVSSSCVPYVFSISGVHFQFARRLSAYKCGLHPCLLTNRSTVCSPDRADPAAVIEAVQIVQWSKQQIED